MNSSLPKELTFCPYRVLELDPKSKPTDKAITKAYKLMALKTHPDKNPSAEARAKFEQVKLASQVLLNEELRGAYDKVLEARWLQEERMKRQGLDRQKIVEDLLQREKDYQEALLKKVSSKEEKEEMERKVETELEKLVREIK